MTERSHIAAAQRRTALAIEPKKYPECHGTERYFDHEIAASIPDRYEIAMLAKKLSREQIFGWDSLISPWLLLRQLIMWILKSHHHTDLGMVVAQTSQSGKPDVPIVLVESCGHWVRAYPVVPTQHG